MRRVDLSACLQCSDSEADTRSFLSRSVFGGSGLEEIRLPRALKVIGMYTFALCKNLKSVSFDADSALEEIGIRAFWGSGLESFSTPPSMKKIEPCAFFQCRELKNIALNEGLEEFGWLSLWMTPLCHFVPSPRVSLTLNQLGVGHKRPEILCLPQGLEVAGYGWFQNTTMEKVIVPSSVRELGGCLFSNCRHLSELIFEPGSRLERIGKYCF